MKQIIVQPLALQGRRPYTAYLVDDSHAVTYNGEETCLLRVRLTEEGNYTPYKMGNHIPIARGGRTVSALDKIVSRLKSMSAYELLTQHYDIRGNTFYINKKEVEEG